MLQAWHYDVMSANENNTFRVCKLLRPPKLAWFEASGDPPTSTYINYLGRTNNYNIIIDEFYNNSPKLIEVIKVKWTYLYCM